MSQGNYETAEFLFLRTERQLSGLTREKREAIAACLYRSCRQAFWEYKGLPGASQEEDILAEVMKKLDEGGIPISGAVLAEYYASVKAELGAHLLRELGQDADYGMLLSRAEGLIAAERHVVPLFSNISALLNETLRQINWVGFYLVTADGSLVVGPFQGRVACIRIEKGRGVCGTALARRETVRVENVHDFPGHIACDAASLSELVVPVKNPAGEVVAVLDVDSPMEGRFFPRDSDGLEALCALLGRNVIMDLQ